MKLGTQTETQKHWHRHWMVAGMLIVGGCGLVDSNVADFNLDLPAKEFSVDATSWNVNQTSADAYLAQSCAAMPTACATAAAAVCTAGTCAGVCNAAQTCDLQLAVSKYQSIDLLTEKPELKTINDQPVIKVSIDRVQYEVKANTMNVDVPELTVYVAPATVMNPSDPLAKPIGKIPAVMANTTVSAREIEFTPTGKADLVAAMSSYQTPFNVIVGSTITVSQGQPVPTGRMDAAVQITAHAGL